RRLVQETYMQNGLTKAALPEPRKRLVELMQSINFGRIESLVIRNGDPVFDPPPRMIREVKLGGENGPRPELDAGNFLLKTQVVERSQRCDQRGDTTIEGLEAQQGLPFRILVAEAAA